MTLDECFAHPLWMVFEEFMRIRMSRPRHWRWVEDENNWRPYWECFLCGVSSERNRILDKFQGFIERK